MNTNDLRQVLREDADEAPIVPTSELMAGVQREIKVRRRNRWVSAAVAAAVLALAIAVVPHLVDNSAPEPVEPTPDRQADSPFPRHLLGGTRLASHVNSPGETRFSWEVRLKERPSQDGTVLSVVCFVPRDAWSPRLAVVAYVDGVHFGTARCWRFVGRQPPDRILQSQILEWGPNRISDKPGRAHTVTLRLRGTEADEALDAVFGFALYQGVTPVDPPDIDQ